MEYTKCLVQLDEVLNYLAVDDLEKIPLDIRDSIKQRKDKEYIWKYDISKNLKDQDLDRQTIAMLSYLNMEYLLNKEQKEYMEKIHQMNELKLEREKQKQTNNFNKLFEKDITKTQEEKKLHENVAMVEYKDSIFKSIIKKIKKIFMKN